MAKNQNLMTEKEKAYVAACFNKNIKHCSAGLALDKIFDGQQIECDIQDGKKEVKQSFGKIGKRSKKWQRIAATSEQPFLEGRIALSELLDTNAILKFVTLDEEGKQELEESSLAYFQDNFDTLLTESKFSEFFEDFFTICSSSTKSKVLLLLARNISHVNDVEKICEIFGNFGNLRFDCSRISKTDLFHSYQGYLFATSVLSMNNNASAQFLDAFISCNNPVLTPQTYAFLNCLDSLLKNENQKQCLIEKINSIKGVDVTQLGQNLQIKLASLLLKSQKL